MKRRLYKRRWVYDGSSGNKKVGKKKKKNKVLDFVKLEYYKKVLDFNNIKYHIAFCSKAAVPRWRLT